MRIYEVDAERPSEYDKYRLSVLADDSGVDYVMRDLAAAKDSPTYSPEAVGETVKMFERVKGRPPEGEEEWLRIGTHNVGTYSAGFPGPDYDSLEEARRGEEEFARRAQAYVRDLGNFAGENDIFADEPEDDETDFPTSDYLVYLNDDGKPEGLIGKVPDLGWSLRRDGEWVPPTEEDLEEVSDLEDFDPAYVTSGFVAEFDKSGTDTDAETVRMYLVADGGDLPSGEPDDD
jgi:hypothetical protein